MSDSLRLPIAKYSYSPEFPVSSEFPVASESRMPWTTIGNANMAMVIEPSKFGLLNASNAGLCIKIVHDSKILELIQLQRLCEAAATAPWNRKPIQAVVSCPRLAITWHLGDGNARRLQCRFVAEADFSSAVGVLEDLRCPITAATNRPRTGQRLNHLTQTANDFGERPTTSGSVDTLASHQITTPLPDDGSVSQGYVGFARNVRKSPLNDERERSHFFQSQIRPSTAPIANTASHDRDLPQHWSAPSDRWNYSSHSPRTAARDAPVPPISVSELPPLPTPTLSRKTSQTTSSLHLRGRGGHLAEDSQRVPEALSKTTSLAISPPDQRNISQLDQSSPCSWNITRTQESNPLSQLRDYAAQPNSERQAAVDAMLCRYINSNDFLKLCEDVENSWRRIGLEAHR